MTSLEPRNPEMDDLLSPENSMFLLIDYQPTQVNSINSWEDKEFNAAVKKIGRKNIIICGLWTEACLTFPTLDALKEGFEVFVPADAVGGTSKTAHEMALRRVEQAGAKMTSLAQIACEFQRDWNRSETVSDFVKIMQDSGLFLRLE